MMERQVLVVSTGGREGFAMVRGIRSAGVFCVQTQAGAKLEIPEETRGAVVIGAADDAVRSSIDALRAKGLPVLAFGGACASLCEALGGEITGHAVTNQLKDVHFANIGVCSGVDGGMRMIDSAEYLSLPQGCRTLSVCEGATIAFDDGKGVSAGFQFIPEAHDVEASEIIGNFLWNVLHLEPNYNCESFIEQTVREIRAAVGDGQAVCVLSGGVDSTTAACLARRAVGDRLHCLVIDKGLEPDGEVERIRSLIGKGLGLEIRQINAAGRMMDQLQGCVTPESKRKAVAQFISDRIADEAARLGGRVTVIRATNYPDVLEGHASSALPGDIPFAEPLRELFKDEVRAVAAALSVPEEICQRQHYPSAGIALRCMGAVNAQKLSILRAADAILQETVAESGLKKPNMRAFVVLTDFAEAFQSDAPRYVLALRVVTGTSEERPHVLRLPQDAAERAAARMLSEVPNVYRVLYDLSPIPPARVEWE